MFKKSTIYFLLASNFIFTFAADCSLPTTDAPALANLSCVLGRIINILLMVVGGVFIAMIAYGAYKAAMSVGDAKAFGGAITHWQYTLLGFGVVVGVFAIISIVSRLLGINILNVNAAISQMEAGLNNLYMLTQPGTHSF